jgi:hypothetical protein
MNLTTANHDEKETKELVEQKPFSLHTHYRLHHDRIRGDGQNEIKTKGGMTVALVEVDGVFVWAWARCSLKDVFSKKLGRMKAYAKVKGLNVITTPKIDFKGIRKVSDEIAKVGLRYADEFDPDVLLDYKVDLSSVKVM